CPIDQAMLENLRADILRRMKHDGRLLYAGKDAAGHGAKPSRPGIGFRLEDAAKRIQVVTEDAGALGRQRVNELAVAVIADVKQIELVAHVAAREARIIAHAIDQPIDVERAGASAEVARVSSELRADTSRLKLQRGIVLEFAREHLRDQIHARPALFGIITEDRQALGHN